MRTRMLFLLLLMLGLTGCAGTQSFTTAARAGDTVALWLGWNKAVNRNNLEITFQPATDAGVIYAPGDSRIRAVVQLPADPVSQMVVGAETRQDFAAMEGSFLGSYIYGAITKQDAEWIQSVAYVDLPSTLLPGLVNITLRGPNGSITSQPIVVDILPGAGSANQFMVPYSTNGYAAGYWLPSVERRNYYGITFTGATIPNSIQVDLTRRIGTSIPWVVNPRGDLKNLSWSDDGSTKIRVILTPSHGAQLTDLKHFKFYVAGGVSDLAVASVMAYDVSGNPVAGITANVTYTP